MPPMPDMEKMHKEMAEQVESNLEKNLPKFGMQYRDALELLSGNERLDVSAIKGLEEKIIPLVKSNIPVRVQTPAKAYKVITRDISSELDGSTKSFYWGTHFGISGVFSSSFPNVMRPVIDYTENARGITFTSQIEAATTLASGQTVIIQYLR